MRKLLFAALIAGAAPAAAQVPQINIDAAAPGGGIAVSETVDTWPDIAWFDDGVTATAPTATEAMTQVARQMESVIARIRAAGVANEDIQTTGINLHPQHDMRQRMEPMPGPPRIVGYNASNNVRIRYRRLGDLGRLIDALVAAGATNINGPNFAIEDPEAQLRAARDRAIASAGQKATEYARRVGARSARLLSITETGTRQYGEAIVVTGSRIGVGMAPPPPPPSPVEPGQVTTSFSIFAQYALEP